MSVSSVRSPFTSQIHHTFKHTVVVQAGDNICFLKYISDKRCDPRLVGHELIRSAESTEIITDFLFEFLAKGAANLDFAVKLR